MNLDDKLNRGTDGTSTDRDSTPDSGGDSGGDSDEREEFDGGAVDEPDPTIPDDPLPTRDSPQSKIFKRFDFSRDVILSKKRTIEKELFSPNKAIGKPFNTGTYTLEEIPADTTYPAYNSPTFQLKNATSGITYLSTMRGESGSYSDTDNSITYRYMVNLTDEDVYDDYYSTDPERSSDLKIESLDIISVAREFAKDGLDMEYFGLAIDPTAGTTENTDYGAVYDNATDGLVGLFPSSVVQYTPLGEKYHLYRYATGEFYDSTTDTFTMPDKANLDFASKAFGEVYPDQGMIVLYLDVLEAEYGTLVRGTNALNYVALLGGNSESVVFSNVYFVRLENTEFNYTNNPTAFREDNPDIYKDEFAGEPKTFPTTIGFHNDDGELIAVGKLSKPFEKNFSEEALIRAEMGY